MASNMFGWSLKDLLILLIVLLGVQFCSPVPSDAGQLQQMAIENLTKKEGLEIGLDLKPVTLFLTIFAIAFCPSILSDVPVTQLVDHDQHIQEVLLPVAGLFPSAP